MIIDAVRLGCCPHATSKCSRAVQRASSAQDEKADVELSQDSMDEVLPFLLVQKALSPLIPSPAMSHPRVRPSTFAAVRRARNSGTWGFSNATQASTHTHTTQTLDPSIHQSQSARGFSPQPRGLNRAPLASSGPLVWRNGDGPVQRPLPTRRLRAYNPSHTKKCLKRDRRAWAGSPCQACLLLATSEMEKTVASPLARHFLHFSKEQNISRCR